MSTTSFLNLQKELRSRVRLDLNEADQLERIKFWINQSQQEIHGRHDWPWAFDREIVQTVADITSGTVSVSAGATTVTGSSTAFAAADVGKFIQFSSSDDWYKIASVASTTSLEMEKAYTKTSALSAGTYTIRKVFYSLSSSVEKILSVRSTVEARKLDLVHFREKDRFRPNQDGTSKASSYIIYGYDSSNNWQICLDPPPDEVYNLEVRFKKKATDLSADADVSIIPEKWHSTVLLDGALYRALEYTRSDFNDRRAEVKRNQFEEGIARMVMDGEPESDMHIVLENPERATGILNYVRLPAKYGE